MNRRHREGNFAAGPLTLCGGGHSDVIPTGLGRGWGAGHFRFGLGNARWPRREPQTGRSAAARRGHMTLEDTVEFFNLVLELKLTQQDKADLVAFVRQL
jgi:hypothetical protein